MECSPAPGLRVYIATFHDEHTPRMKKITLFPQMDSLRVQRRIYKRFQQKTGLKVFLLLKRRGPRATKESRRHRNAHSPRVRSAALEGSFGPTHASAPGDPMTKVSSASGADPSVYVAQMCVLSRSLRFTKLVVHTVRVNVGTHF